MEVMSGIEAERFMVDGIWAGGSEDGCSPIEKRTRRWGEIRTMPLFPPLGKPKYIEALEKELIRQQELTVTPVIVKLAPGEEDTTELLRSLGEETMERSLNEKKIRSATINCEGGTTFEGKVTRMMGCPYDVSSQELTVKIGKPTGNYGIKEVIFQNPTTIVFWTDGTKTVVNCMDNVEMKKKIVDGKEVTVKKPRFSPNFSKETGLAMAIAKKWAGNQGNYNDIFRKYIDEVE